MSGPLRESFWVKLCRVIARWQWLILLLALPAFILVNPARSPILLLLPILWLVRKAGEGRFVPATPLNVSIVLLLLMLLVSVLVTFDLAFSLPKVAGVLFGVALFYAMVDLGRRSPRHLWLGAGMLVAAGLGVVLLGLVGVDWRDKLPIMTRLLPYLPERLLNVPGGNEGVNPNEIGGVLLWTAPLALGVALGSVRRGVFDTLFSARLRRFLAPALWGIAVAQCGMIVLTQSRAGLLGLAASALLLAVLMAGRRRRLFVGILLAMAVVGVVAILQSDGQRLTELLFAQAGIDSAENVAGSLAGRREIWTRALYGIQDFPITGMGMNTFREVVHILYPLFLIPPGTDIAHAHNHLLQVALDLGLPGLIAYLAVWIGAAAMLLRTWRAATSIHDRALAAGLGASLMGYFVYGLVDAVALGARPGFLFWFLLGLIAAQYALVGDSRQRNAL